MFFTNYYLLIVENFIIKERKYKEQTLTTLSYNTCRHLCMKAE